MNCPSCGNNLKPNESFCTHCGRKLDNSNNNDNKKKKRRLLFFLLPFICLVVIATLVIFFILSARSLKNSTVELVLPEISKEESIAADGVITFIIDGIDTKKQKEDDVSRSKDGVVYYYEGKPDLKNGRLREIGIDSVRTILANKNHELITKIDSIKQEWSKGNIDDDKYRELVKKARDAQAADSNAHRVIVSIKPTSSAAYADVVRLLDEMQINYISTYQIEALNKKDSVLYEKATGHPIRTNN